MSLRADPECFAVVEVNVVRFSRALVNLLDNARKANLQAGGKHITLSWALQETG